MPRKIGDKYYTDFRFEGKRVRMVMPEARTQQQAERLESRIRDQMFEGTYGNPAKATVFVDFARNIWIPWAKENNRSHHDNEARLKVFQTFFKRRTFAEISPLLIEKFKRERLNTPVMYGKKDQPKQRPRKPASVNRDLASLSKIFSLAIAKRIIRENPVSQVEPLIENNHRTRFLQIDEEQRLKEALKFYPYLEIISTVALHTGMRRGEILKLEWRDVHLSKGYIHVRETKSGHNRDVPINQAVRDALESWRLSVPKESPWVFPGTGRTGHIVEIKKAWKEVLKLAKISDFRFHDLRHTTGSRLIAVGANPVVVKEVLGHRSLKTTERYTHAFEQQKQSAISALENFGQKYVKSPFHNSAEQALTG